MEANKRQKERMAAKIVNIMGEDLSGVKIGVLGLTFKPNTDDMRDAPSLTIVPELLKRGAKIRAYDPEGVEDAARFMPEVNYVGGAYAVCDGVDALVILTEWNQFRNLDMKQVKEAMRPRSDGRYLFFDFRNIYDPAPMTEQGFQYIGVGR